MACKLQCLACALSLGKANNVDEFHYMIWLSYFRKTMQAALRLASFQEEKKKKIPSSNIYKLHGRHSSKVMDVAWMCVLNLAGTELDPKNSSFLSEPACVRTWEVLYRQCKHRGFYILLDYCRKFECPQIILSMKIFYRLIMLWLE